MGPASSDPVSRYVDFLLENQDVINNFGELLVPINVGFVVLLKEVDYLSYSFLDRQTDLEVLLSNDRLTLYGNLHPTSRVYGANRVEAVKDMEEFLELSSIQNVMDYVYVFDQVPEGDTSPHEDPLVLLEEGVISLRIASSDSQYAV